MAPARQAAALALLLLAACGAPARTQRAPGEPARFDLQARLAARAASLVGKTDGFSVAGQRYNADCTGFVQAVYALEGVPLRALMRKAAPRARSGVRAAFRTAERFGVVFGGGGEWPAPGDLVFWHHTYDRNRNGKADDLFTHVGVVEYVSEGTVVFLHRGSTGVVRGAMTPALPRAKTANGYIANTPIRARGARPKSVPVLAGALFAGYGRIDPARLPPDLVAAR